MRPGSRTECTGTPPSASAVARAVPEGASFLPSPCSSTISARGRWRAASVASRIIRTAPSAKFGTTSNARPRSAASAPSGAGSQPLVPTTHGTPCSSAARTFASTATGAVKSTIASA